MRAPARRGWAWMAARATEPAASLDANRASDLRGKRLPSEQLRDEQLRGEQVHSKPPQGENRLVEVLNARTVADQQGLSAVQPGRANSVAMRLATYRDVNRRLHPVHESCEMRIVQAPQAANSKRDGEPTAERDPATETTPEPRPRQSPTATPL